MQRQDHGGWARAAAFASVLAVSAWVHPASADEVITKIAISAPPAKVWAVLTDFSAYPAWNPFITRIAGKPAVGEEIDADLHTTNIAPRDHVKARILIADPEHQLRWRGSLPGLFSGEHYWIVRPAPGGTELEQGEVFRGVLVPFIKPERLRVDYEAMNRAMKTRVESAP